MAQLENKYVIIKNENKFVWNEAELEKEEAKIREFLENQKRNKVQEDRDGQ